MNIKNALVLCTLSSVFAGDLRAQGRIVELFDPAAPENLAAYHLHDCTASVIKEGKGDDEVLRIEYGHKVEWPSIKLTAEALNFSPDWSSKRYLAVTLSNPGREPVTVGLRIDSALDHRRGRQDTVSIDPSSTIRWLISIDADAGIIGMRGQPPVASDRGREIISTVNYPPLDNRAITHFQLFMPKPERSHTILLHKLNLIDYEHEGKQAFVDRYGQYNGTQWPGKISSDDELKSNAGTEAEFLKKHPMLSHYSRFGGWKDGLRQKASGRFRVKKIAGKWWLIDPEGYLFWSSGTTGVRAGGNATCVGRRRFCFNWLPEGDDPLAPFYSRGKNSSMDFFQANLQRKYGPDYLNTFYDVSIRRLQSWGMNTIANWSDEQVCRMRRVPYVIPIHIRAKSFVADSHRMAGLTKLKHFPDPFDPEYEESVAEHLRGMRDCIGDPWLLGVFVDNELPWTSAHPERDGPWVRIPVPALCVNGAETHIKRVLIAELRGKYKTVDALNKVWMTRFVSWDEMLEPLTLSGAQVKAAEKDILALEAMIAECYFRKTRDALKRCDPEILYLGPRFSGRFTPEVVAIAAKYCDVVSFNIYEYLPDMRQVDELALAHDFPVIIGEFHFGALDRGMFHTGLRKADNQAERARKYTEYVECAARASWCVGAHWFQYKDQPLTGRGDGENYNIGFITETDSVYPELSSAARELHLRLYETRAAHPNSDLRSNNAAPQ